MSEFLLILPGGAPRGCAAQVGDGSSAAILRQLEDNLAALDRAGAGMAAAYLAMAIDHARAHFDRTDDSSGSD